MIYPFVACTLVIVALVVMMLIFKAEEYHPRKRDDE